MADMDAGMDLTEMVYRIVSGLVDQPQAVKVLAQRARPGCVVLDVSVDSNDLGQVIGKQGRTARSMRTIVGACAKKAGVHCELNFMTAAAEAGA